MMNNDQTRTWLPPRGWTEAEIGPSNISGDGENNDFQLLGVSDFVSTSHILNYQLLLLPGDDDDDNDDGVPLVAHEAARSTSEILAADAGNISSFLHENVLQSYINSWGPELRPVELQDRMIEVFTPPELTRYFEEPAHTVQDSPGRLCRPPTFKSEMRLRTKNEPWKAHWRDAISRFCSSSEVHHESGNSLCNGPSTSLMENILPSPDPDEFLVTGAGDLFCINVGKAPGSEKLIVYNPKTEKFNALPPLTHSRHPVLMHIIVDERGEYKVLVSGSANNSDSELSRKTDVYNSMTGEWKCCADFPCPLISEFQTGAFHKDSEGREFLFCVADLNTERRRTKAVLMFDFKKCQWVIHDSQLKCHVKGVADSHIASTQIVGCGGSIFLFSELENGRDTYLCIHKLNPESTFGSDGNMWEEILQRKWTDSGDPQCSQRLQVYNYLEFMCVPLCATVLENGGFVVVFSEQESGKTVFICIHMLIKMEGSGGHGNTWEEIMRRKKRRHRSKNWEAEEITAYLKSKKEGLEVVVGKDWEYISKRLEESHGIVRGSQSCEDLWGTLLKRHTDISEDLQSKNIRPNTSGWVNYWKSGGNQRSRNKLIRVFSLECYEMMARIQGIKPRKVKSGSAGNKLKDHATNTRTLSTLNSLLDDSICASPNSSDHLQAANLTLESTAPVIQSFDSEDDSLGHDDEQQTSDEPDQNIIRPGCNSLISEVSGLCDYLLQGRQNLTNEQVVKVKEDAFNYAKSKVQNENIKYQLALLKEKKREKINRRAPRDSAERRPSKARKKNAL